MPVPQSVTMFSRTATGDSICQFNILVFTSQQIITGDESRYRTLYCAIAVAINWTPCLWDFSMPTSRSHWYLLHSGLIVKTWNSFSYFTIFYWLANLVKCLLWETGCCTMLYVCCLLSAVMMYTTLAQSVLCFHFHTLTANAIYLAVSRQIVESARLGL